MHLPRSNLSALLATDNADLIDEANPTVSRLVIDDTSVYYDTSPYTGYDSALSSTVQSLVDDVKASSFNHTLAVITAPTSFRYRLRGCSRIAVYGALLPLRSGPLNRTATAWAKYTVGGTSVTVHVPEVPSTTAITHYPLFTSAELNPNEECTLTADIWASPDSPYIFDYLVAFKFSLDAPAYLRDSLPASSSRATNSTSISTPTPTPTPTSIIVSNPTSALTSTSNSFSIVTLTSTWISESTWTSTWTTTLTSGSTSTSTPAPTSSTQPFPAWAIVALVFVGSLTLVGIVWLIYHNKRRSERLLERWPPPAPCDPVPTTGPVVPTRGRAAPAQAVTRPHAGTRYSGFPPQLVPQAYMVAAAYPISVPTPAGIVTGTTWQPLRYYPGPAYQWNPC